MAFAGACSRAGRRIATASRGSVVPPLVWSRLSQKYPASATCPGTRSSKSPTGAPRKLGIGQIEFAPHHPLRNAAFRVSIAASSDMPRVSSAGASPVITIACQLQVIAPMTETNVSGFIPPGLSADSTGCMPQINDRYVDPENGACSGMSEICQPAALIQLPGGTPNHRRVG